MRHAFAFLAAAIIGLAFHAVAGGDTYVAKAVARHGISTGTPSLPGGAQYSVVCEDSNARYKVCNSTVASAYVDGGSSCDAGSDDYLIVDKRGIDVLFASDDHFMAFRGVAEDGGDATCRVYRVSPSTFKNY